MKIVSLFPAGSEIICEMGLSENLIAVSHECDYPALLKKKNSSNKQYNPQKYRSDFN